MSRVEEVELLNRILDKLHAYLTTVPQVDSIPVYGREARLRQALSFLKNQLDAIDRDGNGMIAAGGLLLLFHSDLKALQISETRHLADYVIRQSG